MSEAELRAGLRAGAEAFGRGDFALALARCRDVLAGHPSDPAAAHLAGLAAAQLGRLDDALAAFAIAVRGKPQDAELAVHHAVVLLKASRAADALAALDRALALAPSTAFAHYNRGVALAALGRTSEARDACDRALDLQPALAPALRNRGDLALADDDHEGALRDYDRLLAAGHADAGLLVNRGVALQRSGRELDALASFDAAVAADPRDADAHFDRANVLAALYRLPEALVAYDRAVALREGFATAWHNRGTTFLRLARPDEAIASFDRALALDPVNADTWTVRGNALRAARRDLEALESYRRALDLAPEAAFVRGSWLQAKLTVCDWQDLDDDFRDLAARIASGEAATAPFPVLAMPFTETLQQTAARRWSAARHPPRAPRPPAHAPRADGRIHIGYFAATLHEHPMAYLMAELFEKHDRARFVIHAFSFGPDPGGPLRARLVRAFDAFHDVRGHSDEAVAARARELGIDIGVDLMGYTQDARPDIFAWGVAPVHVQYMGFPGTLGSPNLDYVIADAIVLPPGADAHYDERIVRLPGSYMVNDAQRPRADVPPPRDTLGLPAHGFVFCCFNNSYKILPSTFDAWMRILHAVDGSVLWLLEDNAAARANLQREAAARDVDPARLVFAPRVPHAEYLARHHAADLVLDTLPYNAHTTASDALWAGVPVLTLAGDTFAGRVAASLLHAVGLGHAGLVTTSQGEYEARAIALARDPAALAALRETLSQLRAQSPLFDAAAFARHLETAFETMLARRSAGLPPAAFDVT